MPYPRKDAKVDAKGAKAAAKWRRVRWTDNREPATRATPLGRFSGCWCGGERDHDWPGKADGLPHPRESDHG